jgi:hypothetical protein
MAMLMTSAWLGIPALTLVPGSGEIHDVVAWTFLVLIIGAMLLIPWMILFAWPRFLVPPAFRGPSGWLVTTSEMSPASNLLTVTEARQADRSSADRCPGQRHVRA